MISLPPEIKYHIYCLTNSMVRNINDNFNSISFEITNREIVIKFVLSELTERESNFIEDIVSEFVAIEGSDCLKDYITEVGYGSTLKYLVYSRKFV